MFIVKQIDLDKKAPGVVVATFDDHESAVSWIIVRRGARKPGDSIVHGIVQ